MGLINVDSYIELEMIGAPFWQRWEQPIDQSGGFFDIENPETGLRLAWDSVNLMTVLVRVGKHLRKSYNILVLHIELKKEG